MIGGYPSSSLPAGFRLETKVHFDRHFVIQIFAIFGNMAFVGFTSSSGEYTSTKRPILSAQRDKLQVLQDSLVPEDFRE